MVVLALHELASNQMLWKMYADIHSQSWELLDSADGMCLSFAKHVCQILRLTDPFLNESPIRPYVVVFS